MLLHAVVSVHNGLCNNYVYATWRVSVTVGNMLTVTLNDQGRGKTRRLYWESDF
jgi:hypothetical protein